MSLGEEYQSRKEYREQLAKAKQAQTNDVDNNPQEANEDTESMSRQAALANDYETAQEEKTQLLKHKLNIAITVLLILIMIVYIVLFFVG